MRTKQVHRSSVLLTLFLLTALTGIQPGHAQDMTDTPAPVTQPPADTPVPPTEIVLPTATLIPPTQTPVSPTVTPLPPSPTLAPPTATPLPSTEVLPTETPLPPSPTKPPAATVTTGGLVTGLPPATETVEGTTTLMPSPTVIPSGTADAAPLRAASPTPGMGFTPTPLAPSLPQQLQGGLTDQQIGQSQAGRTIVEHNVNSVSGLQTAISAANTGGTSETHVIYLQAGTYNMPATMTLNNSVHVIIVGGDGITTVTQEAVDAGYNPATDPRPIIRSGSSGSRNIFQLGTLTRLFLYNLRIEDGFTDSSNLHYGGGAISGSGSIIEAYKVTFRDNNASNSAVINNYFGAIDVHSSEFINNSALDGGGVMWNRGNEVTITCSNVYDNTAGYGGALANYPNEESISVRNSNFVGNQATWSGSQWGEAIYTGTQIVDAQFNWWNGVNPSTVTTSNVNTANAQTNKISIYTDPNCTTLPDWVSIPTPAASYKYQELNVGSASWSANEIQAIEVGVDQVGQALLGISTNPTTSVDVFNRVIVDGGVTDFILFIRADVTASTIGGPEPDVTINYTDGGNNYTVTYEDIKNGNCKAYDSGFIGTTPRPRAAICNGSLAGQVGGEATEHTIVHELGHLFDYRAGDALRSGIDGSFALGSCISNVFNGNNYVIMGVVGSQPWSRGSAGWGSGPGFSTFQQNPENTPLEAVADMFLNWVYRDLSPNGASLVSGIDTTNGNQPTGGCGSTPPGTWDGFQNIWWQSTPPTNDTGLPGDVRFTYMNGRMSALMSANSW